MFIDNIETQIDGNLIDMKSNYKFAISAASNLHNFYDHKTLVMIAKDLALIAGSDGELHDNEVLFWTDCLNNLTRVTWDSIHVLCMTLAC